MFSSGAKTISFLYRYDDATLRKAGDRNDPYEIFKRSVRTGKLEEDFSANQAMLDERDAKRNLRQAGQAP